MPMWAVSSWSFTQYWYYSIKYWQCQAWRTGKFGRLPKKFQDECLSKVNLDDPRLPQDEWWPKGGCQILSSCWKSPSPSALTPGHQKVFSILNGSKIKILRLNILPAHQHQLGPCQLPWQGGLTHPQPGSTALLLLSLSIIETCILGAVSTPRSLGVILATFFFFAFIMFGRVAYRGSLSLGFINEFRFRIVHLSINRLPEISREDSREGNLYCLKASINLSQNFQTSISLCHFGGKHSLIKCR